MPKTKEWHWYVEEFAPAERHHHAVDAVCTPGRSEFQQIAVLRSPVFGKMLVLDGDTQSAQTDERVYHEALVHPALAGAAERREVLILGGGEGATLREVLRSPEVVRCTMVDIDALVVDLAKKYLPEWSAGSFDDPRARVVAGDALAFMRASDERYDVIISDLTEPLADSPSNPLFNDQVFRLIKSRLVAGGIYVLRPAPRRCTTRGFTARWRARCALTTRTSFPLSTHVPAFDTEWAFLACSDLVDLANLDPKRIDAYCAALCGESFFYDSLTHRRLFALPLYFRRMLAAGGETF